MERRARKPKPDLPREWQIVVAVCCGRSGCGVVVVVVVVAAVVAVVVELL